MASHSNSGKHFSQVFAFLWSKSFLYCLEIFGFNFFDPFHFLLYFFTFTSTLSSKTLSKVSSLLTSNYKFCCFSFSAVYLVVVYFSWAEQSFLKASWGFLNWVIKNSGGYLSNFAKFYFFSSSHFMCWNKLYYRVSLGFDLFFFFCQFSCFVAAWVLVLCIDSFCLFFLLVLFTFGCLTWFVWSDELCFMLFCFQLFLKMCYWEGCSAMEFICGAVTWIG